MAFEGLKREAFGNLEIDHFVQATKRREARQRVLLRAQLHSIDAQGEIRVTDLSRSGLRGVTDLGLGVDQNVFVSLDDITHCSGTVRWTQDQRVGVKFCHMLEALPQPSHMDEGKLPDHQDRMPRITTNLAAKITLCSSSAIARIRNVSKSGMMVETAMPLTTNTQLLVSLSDGKILGANVKWVEGDRVGIQLSSPVSILQFTYGNLE